MRIAIVSDIHSNRTAFEAVLADLRRNGPDLILHGGDLANGGAHPAEILDQIRDLGWPGVLGNTDEMLFDPVSLEDFARESPGFRPLAPVVEAMAAFEREALGAERLAWLRTLPRVEKRDDVALVHASPAATWRSPTFESSDAEFESVYGPLGRPVVVYGHTHRALARSVAGMTIINAGSVSLSFDGDSRAAYLLLDNGKPEIRRVEYDVEAEIADVLASGLPHAEWIARTLRSAVPQMP